MHDSARNILYGMLLFNRKILYAAALFKDWFLGININRAIINYVTQMKVINPGLRERGLLPERIKYEESV